MKADGEADGDNSAISIDKVGEVTPSTELISSESEDTREAAFLRKS